MTDATVLPARVDLRQGQPDIPAAVQDEIRSLYATRQYRMLDLAAKFVIPLPIISNVIRGKPLNQLSKKVTISQALALLSDRVAALERTLHH